MFCQTSALDLDVVSVVVLRHGHSCALSLSSTSLGSCRFLLFFKVPSAHDSQWISVTYEYHHWYSQRDRGENRGVDACLTVRWLLNIGFDASQVLNTDGFKT